MRTERENDAVGGRLRTWGLSHYESLAEFARALKIHPAHLSAYLADRYRPGNKLQEKLRALGCDMDWLMSGEAPQGKARKKVKRPPLGFRVLSLESLQDRAAWKGRRSEVLLDYSPSEHVFLRASSEVGRANAPAIEEGDLLLIKMKSVVKPDHLVVACSGSRNAVGILQPMGGPSIVRPLNPASSMVVLPQSARFYPVILIRKR